MRDWAGGRASIYALLLLLLLLPTYNRRPVSVGLKKRRRRRKEELIKVPDKSADGARPPLPYLCIFSGLTRAPGK